MAWLDRLPIFALLVLGLALGLAPFQAEPHLVQKLRMLFEGSLSRPVDVFDLFWHGLPLLLLALKVVRVATVRSPGPNRT
jgi:hypothetical protein